MFKKYIIVWKLKEYTCNKKKRIYLQAIRQIYFVYCFFRLITKNHITNIKEFNIKYTFNR